MLLPKASVVSCSKYIPFFPPLRSFIPPTGFFFFFAADPRLGYFYLWLHVMKASQLLVGMRDIGKPATTTLEERRTARLLSTTWRISER